MGAERFELTERESLTLLQGQSIGRLCLIDHGYPLAIPISYSIASDDTGGVTRVVIRTAPETMLGRYEGLASLEVDSIDLDAGVAWSVIVRGALARVIGTFELPDPKPLITEGRHRWMTLDMRAITGRRFLVNRAADGFSVDWQLTSA